MVYKDTGFYTDRAIRKTPLPKIQRGKNILRITLPFGKCTNLERIYVLGSFGVKVIGRKTAVTELPKTLVFDDIAKQGLPFYGGSVRYILPLDCKEDGKYLLRIPHFRAAVLTVGADGKRIDNVAYPPYILDIGKLSEGRHEVVIEAYISRHNCFGHVHCADERLRWLGPNSWYTSESSWTYEYRILPEGIISTPIFYKSNI